MSNNKDTDIVYSSDSRDESNRDPAAMSEKVQTIASGIYNEFQHMIKVYDENVVKRLMPLVVGVLEGLNQSYLEKQEIDVEIELLKTDNEQLLTQYEREKNMRRETEQKYLETEDIIDENKKLFDIKFDKVENSLKLFELKARNAQEHVSRFEERELEMKNEYQKLHDRYTELFKKHADVLDRSKYNNIDYNADFSDRNIDYLEGDFERERSSTKDSFTDSELNIDKKLFSETESLNNEDSFATQSSEEFVEWTAPGKQEGENQESQQTGHGNDSPISLAASQRSAAKIYQLNFHTSDAESANGDEEDDDNPPNTTASATTDADVTLTAGQPGDVAAGGQMTDSTATIVADEDSADENLQELDVTPETTMPTPQAAAAAKGKKRGNRRHSNNNNNNEDNDGADGDKRSDSKSKLNDSCERRISMKDELNNAEKAPLNLYGIGKEVEILIQENKELLATKNALNIVKDDLIERVDTITSEHDMLKERQTCLLLAKDKMSSKLEAADEEVKKLRAQIKEMEEAENDKKPDEPNVPAAQRKRFTRMEMARVLMERNKYKERLFELQEAVRWAETIRAARDHPDDTAKDNKKKSGGVWSFFSSLLSQTSEQLQAELESETCADGSSSSTTSAPPASNTKLSDTTIV